MEKLIANAIIEIMTEDMGNYFDHYQGNEEEVYSEALTLASNYIQENATEIAKQILKEVN